MYRFLLSIIVFLFIQNVFAQKKKEKDTSAYIHQLNRIEFDMGYSGDEHYIISGGGDGLLVAVDDEERSQQGLVWKLYELDTALNVSRQSNMIVPYGKYFVGYDYNDSKYYMLFGSSGGLEMEYLLMEIDPLEAKIISYEVKLAFAIQLTEFEMLDGKILFCGYTNYRPTMVLYDVHTNMPKVIPGLYDRKGEIIDLKTDDDRGLFTVLVSEKIPGKRNTVMSKTFTEAGDLVLENIIEPGERKSIVDGVSTSFVGGFEYLAGTYSKKVSTYSRGLYLAKFVNGRQQLVKYHEYVSLDNFFGYMNDKREQRVKERLNKRMQNGKSPSRSYRLLVHDIIQRGDEYLLIAEAYFPRYASNYAGYGRYVPTILGYNFTHAIVVAFDAKGDIIWDNSFDIDDYLNPRLEPLVSVNIYDDKIVLMYLDENEINSKVVKGEEILEGKTFNPVKLTYEGDEVKSKDSQNEGLKSWYDKTMYAFGEQRIKNENEAGGKLYRNIFYINKVQYHQKENPN